MEHHAIFISNTVNKRELLRRIKHGEDEFSFLQGLKGVVYSNTVIEYYLEEEARHDVRPLSADSQQEFRTFSSGEKKKALLKYLMKDAPEYLVLDNPFDHLDTATQKQLKEELDRISDAVIIIQLVSRKTDLLPFINKFGLATSNNITWKSSSDHLFQHQENTVTAIPIPEAPDNWPEIKHPIFALKGVDVTYGAKPILKNISWTVKAGEYWELSGKNGSGKTTILSMITGDNPKAYGKDIVVMGYKKGSGESVWDIKKNIGYFSPAITYRFRGYHSILHMIISGLYDSIGLYVKPTDSEINLARQWLKLIGLNNKEKTYFHELSEGERRLVMCARAMVKHPPLLILDEPTASLDDESAKMVVDLVNKMAAESNTAIVFVSHRKEAGLEAQHHYQLKMTPLGSIGIAH